MNRTIEIDPCTLSKLRKKATKSDCTYKISAIAYDKKGDLLGCVSNSHSDWDVVEKCNGEGRAGTAKHAERRILQRYGKNVKSIVICRVGHSGNLRPIEACPACRKAAEKMGVKIYSIAEEEEPSS